ncbi:MAG: undecaprenyldiphospho-muramoylpentapeptide beta-N-acetylglucosaminyltransferase [Acidobacteriota bacterium]
MAERSILIAGGGTGGHIYPGLAVAAEVRRRRPDVPLHWVGTRAGLEARLVPPSGVPLHFIRSAGIAGKSIPRRIAGACLIPVGLAQASALVVRLGAGVVSGVGGYASGPVVLAGRLLGRGTAILEQNAIPGATNRILAPLVDRVAVAFPFTAERLPGRVVVTGNPVREGLADAPDERRDGRSTVLVVGGSRGARGLNTVVMNMLPALAASGLTVRLRHQTGAADESRVSEAYARSGLDAEVVPYITDMASAYAGADLVVCRAGATTLAELSAAGRPAVLVPFPHAAGGHQAENGRQLVSHGAAVMVREEDAGHGRLAEIVIDLLRDGERLRNMEEAVRELGAPAAASRVADLLLDLLDRRPMRTRADTGATA